MIVTVYVCPTPGCENYFASHKAGKDLHLRLQGDRGMNGEFNPEHRHHTRASCPDCWDRGERVERVPVAVVIEEDKITQAVHDAPLPIDTKPAVQRRSDLVQA